MKKRTMLIVAACLVATLWASSAAQAGWRHYRTGASYDAPWQPAYYDVSWGMPQALVVPPTARSQVDYSWNVSGTHRTGFPQYVPIYPGPESVYNPRTYLPAPPQPTSTDQMGDYSVRGPR